MTLLVSLIMLVLITLMAITAFKLGKSSLQIAGNQQERSQALAAAQSAIEQTISSTQFAVTPTNAIPNPCMTTTGSSNTALPNTTCVDDLGNGKPDITVTVAPTCTSSQVVPVAALDYTNPNDAGCLVGAGQDFGVAGGTNNNSMCANMLWDVQATATDAINNAKYVVDQGTAVRVAATTVCP
jgi:Tfp pilus assembly protein PilX